MPTSNIHLASAALMLLLVSVTCAYSEGNVIVEFNGNGTINTKPFETTGPWEIQWKGYLAIEVYGQNNTLAYVFSGRDQTSYVPTSGIFYLNINSIEAWTVTVRAIK
jgi:hypothetical protein